MATKRYEVAVIGGGPGGYPAGIRLGQLGKNACVIEAGDVGGVCLNWGCIPSKAVIHAAELRTEITHAQDFGIGTGQAPVELPKLRDWKNGILTKLRGGIKSLLKANGVDLVEGRATFTGPNTLEVKLTKGGTETIEFEQAVIATGAHPFELPFMPRSNPLVWTAEELLKLEELPEHLICVGGGVIGMETASSFGKLGCTITVIELMDQLLPGTDPELVRPVAQALKKAGATIHLSSSASALTERDGKAVLTVKGPKGEFEVVGDKVMVSIGFRPNSANLGLEKAGVTISERGFVTVDPACRTNVGHIYAIGDVTGMPFLAHRATKMGIVAAEVIGGLPALCDWQAMPLGIFSDPEVAQVGLSEQEAKEAGHEVTVGKFPFAALGRAMAQNSTAGMVKVIGDAKNGILLGVGIVGPRANDLIAEAALAIEMGAAVEDLALTVHSHPTFAEALNEAAEDALGHAIHIARPKRTSALKKQADAMLLKK